MADQLTPNKILLASHHHAFSIITSIELTGLKPLHCIVSRICLHVFLSLSKTYKDPNQVWFYRFSATSHLPVHA